MHVLRHASPSHRLATRFSSSVCRRTLFERLRSSPGKDEFTLKHSIKYITEKPAFRHQSFSFFRRKRFCHESARLSRISSTHSNQPDSLESAGFTFKIPASEPRGSSPTASFHRAIALHSCPQLRVLAVPPHPQSRDFSGIFGFVA